MWQFDWGDLARFSVTFTDAAGTPTDMHVGPDGNLYYVSIFGDPTPTGTWGWRYEGHHLSQNWTVVRGQSIASSPQFFGSNPAEVRDGPKKGTRVLAAEEDLARALLERLTEAQRAKAEPLTGQPVAAM